MIALQGDFNAGSARVLWAPKCFSSSWRNLLRSIGLCNVQLKLTKHQHCALSAWNMKKLLRCDGNLLDFFKTRPACYFATWKAIVKYGTYVSWQIGWRLWTLATLHQNLNPELPSRTMLTFGKCPWSSLFQTIEPLEESERLETLCFAKYRYPQLLQQFFIMDTPPW